jgi:predicted dehydrogenase
MAWNITQCKDMIRAADEAGKLLAIGHQRHYSMLYAHAEEVIRSGVLGDIRHIRALWHRNNVNPLLDAQGREQIDPETGKIRMRDSWRPAIKEEDRRALERDIRRHGYKSMNELVRWRLYKRTGGGLMAELGSHQLDACSIFLGKVKPLAVTAIGGKHFYQDDREIEDHVYCTYEFPGRAYVPGRSPRKPDGTCEHNDTVVVTYSSISTNSFEPYGECIMGSTGTMVIESEQSAYLWGGAGRSTAVTATTAGAGPKLDASSSTDPGERRATDTGLASLGAAPPSRGYREEMEHLAYCIRTRQEGMDRDRANLKPRCDGRAAMADAIIALTSNQSMRRQSRITFLDSWFGDDPREVPDADMQVEEVLDIRNP